MECFQAGMSGQSMESVQSATQRGFMLGVSPYWMARCRAKKRSRAMLRMSGKDCPMLWTIAIIMLLLWGLGLVSGYTMSGFIHILLVVALVAVLVRIISGRPAL